MPSLIAPGYSAAPATPPSGSYLIYFNSTDGSIHIVNSAGTDTALPTSAASFGTLYAAWAATLPTTLTGATVGEFVNIGGVVQQVQ